MYDKDDDQHRPQPPKDAEPAPEGEGSPPETQPAEERGERVDTGRTIGRGGKDTGNVPGAAEPRP